MKEKWKNIKGFEKHSISNLGNIKNNITNNLLKWSLNRKDGYRQVTLQKDKIRKCFPIHRLVALYFIENIYSKSQVNHIDGNKQNNKYDNLEWVTPSENINHGFKKGLITRDSMKGSKNYCSKLKEDEVKEIKKEYSLIKTTHRKLAEKYNVSKSAITNILTNKRWKHI